MSEELKVKVVTGTFGWRHKVLGILSEEADEVEFMTKYLQENRLSPYLCPSEFQVTHDFDRFGKRPNCPEALLYSLERVGDKIALKPSYQSSYVDILFDKLPGPDGCTFIDCVDDKGNGIKAGEWIEREDGTVALRVKL